MSASAPFVSGRLDLRVGLLAAAAVLLCAVWFWWSLARRCPAGLAAWYAFVTMLHMSGLGALLTLAPHVLYRDDPTIVAQFGLTTLEDQQLAGLIMWIPAGTIYAGAALTFMALWILRSSPSEIPRNVAPAA